MNPILNMKRRIGLGLLWLPGIGLPLTCLELFGNKEISDDDRALCWMILIVHVAASVLTFVFYIGLLLQVLCVLYAIFAFLNKKVPEIPLVGKWGQKLAELTKPECDAEAE